jgi:hypothetical protein
VPIFSVGVVLLFVFFRRQSGHSLEQMLEARPDSSVEVVPVLAKIRHEVLKHHTNLLDAMASDLERGDHDGVQLGAIRLFGGGSRSSVKTQFAGRLDELVSIGKKHGFRLNLRHKDPVLAPMWRAMKRLARLESRLRRPWRAGGGTAAALRHVSGALNVVGYRQLGRIVGRAGVRDVGLDLIRQVDRDVREELELSDVPPLLLTGAPKPLQVRIDADDLEVICTNLLRNGYEAGGSAGRMGVRIEEEDDPITGSLWVAIRFQDSAPEPLNAGTIRSRPPGRGLGLVRDLVAHHGGSLGVEPDEGWEKAAVVRFPVVELGLEASDRGGAAVAVLVEEEDQA